MTETTPPGYREPEDATAAMAGDLGDLSADFIALVELQAELFRIDAREAASRGLVPASLTVLAMALVLGACPLAMLGIAWGLSAWTTLSAAAAAILVAVGGLVLAGLLAWRAIRGFRRCAEAMQDSLAELRRNGQWIKTMLKRQRRYRATARSQL